jgi:hypothetical protein
MGFYNFAENGYLEKVFGLYSPLNYDLNEVFLLKLTHISQGKNVLHATASSTDGFLSRDLCISSTLA